MMISEIFCSLQGEGLLVGTPSVFVRTSGCNLRCNWCDTPYASWNPEGEEMPIDRIVTRVQEFGARYCVVTGGEPMIAPGIAALTTQLRAIGMHVTIETAGTIAPNGIACDLASLSPKLSNSRPDNRLPDSWRKRHDRDRLQPEIINQWLRKYSYQLKFVVTSATDMDEIQDLLKQLSHPVDPDRILLMPEGITTEQLQQRTRTIVDLCTRHGYRYGSRLHIDLFGNTRGT